MAGGMGPFLRLLCLFSPDFRSDVTSCLTKYLMIAPILVSFWLRVKG